MPEKRPAILGGKPIRPEGPPDWPGIQPEITASIQQALSDGSWGKYHGPRHERLIESLATLHRVEHVLLCSSGTAAVELALRGANVGPGDEVVLAAYDFKSNFQNVLTVGAVPVLVDIDPLTAQLHVSQLEAACSEKTRAIIASHLHGAFADLPQLVPFAESRGITVIEDACQATGGILNGQRTAAIGHVGILSFGGTKLLSAGRGGAVLTRNPEIAQRIRLYTQRGNDAYPLSELQAAAVLPQLARLDEFNQRRLAAAELLAAKLNSSYGLVPIAKNWLEGAKCAVDRVPAVRPAFYKIGMWYEAYRWGGLPRDLFGLAMRAEGIALDPGFRALHLTHSRRRFRTIGELSNSARADKDLMVLHHPLLLESEPAVRQFLDAADCLRKHAAELLAVAPRIGQTDLRLAPFR